VNYKIIRLILLLAKVFSILISFFIIVIFIGEFNLDSISKMVSYEIILLILIPLLYTVGSLLLFVKEIFGSIIMIFSVFAFNIVSYIVENRIEDFDFFILLVPTIIILFVNKLYKKDLNSKIIKNE